MNLSETIRQARDGDIQAFRGLFEHYKKPVFRFVYGMLGQRQDTEDVIQEIFVVLYRKLHTLNGVEEFEGWLYRIARNKAVDQIRRNQRRQVWQDDDDAPLTMHPIDTADPHASSENRDLERKLTRALHAVPEQTRAAFVLAVVQGFSYREVAKIMGCNINTVKSKVFRARAILARTMAPETDPERVS